MELVYSTGNRENYYNAIKADDCVCRAIANVTGMDYKEVYDLINSYAEREHISKRKKTKSNARNDTRATISRRHMIYERRR